MAETLLLEEAIKVLTNIKHIGGKLDQSLWVSGDKACIGGWCARNQRFRALGLVAYNPETAMHRQGQIMLLRKPPERSLQGFDALQSLFDLTITQADYLFADNPQLTGFERIETFEEAIRRIREVIAGGPAEVSYTESR